MKTCKCHRLTYALSIGLGLALVANTSFGDYSIDWWTIDGGGGSSSGGGYTLDGTAGQPDAATWSGGGYTLVGGFWGGVAVEYRVYLPLVLRAY